MLNISGINNGVVLDHIQAGKSMDIYHYLNLQELDCQVAIIKNAKSSKIDRKSTRLNSSHPPESRMPSSA